MNKGFMFPATVALMLSQHTWASRIAISNALRNYGASGQEFWVKSTRPGNHHWHCVPVPGGWNVRPAALRNPREITSVEPPF